MNYLERVIPARYPEVTPLNAPPKKEEEPIVQVQAIDLVDLSDESGEEEDSDEEDNGAQSPESAKPKETEKDTVPQKNRIRSRGSASPSSKKRRQTGQTDPASATRYPLRKRTRE